MKQGRFRLPGKPFRRRVAGAPTFEVYAERVAANLLARANCVQGREAARAVTVDVLTWPASVDLLRDAFALGWSVSDCAQAFVQGVALIQAAQAKARGRLH